MYCLLYQSDYNFGVITLDCGRIPKALFSARWLKCSSVLRRRREERCWSARERLNVFNFTVFWFSLSHTAWTIIIIMIQNLELFSLDDTSLSGYTCITTKWTNYSVNMVSKSFHACVRLRVQSRVIQVNSYKDYLLFIVVQSWTEPLQDTELVWWKWAIPDLHFAPSWQCLVCNTVCYNRQQHNHFLGSLATSFKNNRNEDNSQEVTTPYGTIYMISWLSTPTGLEWLKQTSGDGQITKTNFPETGTDLMFETEHLKYVELGKTWFISIFHSCYSNAVT